MDPNSAIKKYYIGFAALMVLTLGIFIYTFSLAGSAKTDQETNKAVEKIYNKIGYGDTVPASLAAAGVTDVPDTIKYTKLSNTEYKVCIEYKQASGIFDAGWTSLLGGSFSASSSDTSSSNSKDYFDSSVEYRHKKGQNCQTVKPYIYNYDDSSSYGDSSSSLGGDSTSSANACLNSLSSLSVSGEARVSRIDTVGKTIYFESSGQYIYDDSTSQVLPAVTSMRYDDNTLICDAQTLAKTNISAIKVGDEITIYLNSASDTTISQMVTSYRFTN